MIIAVTGLPGSGKSFLARHLALKIGGTKISSDQVREELKQRGKYDEESKLEVYQEMLALTRSAVHKNSHVVLDATFHKERVRKHILEAATALHVPLYFVEVKAAEVIIKERVTKRRADSDADFNVYLKIKEELEPLKEDHLTLYSDRTDLDEMIGEALRYSRYQDE